MSSTPLTPIHRVLEILDEWAAFGKDLEITEFDLCCKDDSALGVRAGLHGGLQPLEGEGVHHLGFLEGATTVVRGKAPRMPPAATGAACLAQEAWEDLVLRQWWTRGNGTADAGGTATLRAFYGKHRLTAEAGGKRAEATVELTPGKPGMVVLRLK